MTKKKKHSKSKKVRASEKKGNKNLCDKLNIVKIMIHCS